MSRSRDLGDVGSKANFLDNVSTDLGDYSGQSIPHIIPDVLYPAVEGKDLAGVTFSGSYVYGTAHTDGRKYYYTDIKGSKPIKDPRIGGHFGSQRHKFKSLQLLEQETATEGKNVYSVDGREWVRAVGGVAVQNGSAGHRIDIDQTTSFIEIIGFFSDINYIPYSTGGRGVRFTLDGGTEDTTDRGQASVSTPLLSRYVDSGSVVNLPISTSLGIHTVKLRASQTHSARLFGIELIAQDTTSTANRSKIQIPSQNVVSYGKKFTVSGTPHYDPFTTMSYGGSGTTLSALQSLIDTDTSLGMDAWKAGTSNYHRPWNGGRVIKWVDSSGTIKTSVNMMPPNAQNITTTAQSAGNNGDAVSDAHVIAGTNDNTINFNTSAIDHTQSEVAKTFHVREFGNGSANGGTGATYADASMLNSADDIAYVMDDGLTSCSADDFNGNPTTSKECILRSGAGDSIYYTFIGTGLSLLIEAPENTTDQTLQIAQNLPYGTHIFKYEANSSNSDHMDLTLDGVSVATAYNPSDTPLLKYVTFHQPKRPPIPEEAVIISDYCLMADHVKQTSADYGNISKGVRYVSASRDHFYDSSGAFDTANSGIQSMPYMFGLRIRNANANSTGKLPFFGTTASFFIEGSDQASHTATLGGSAIVKTALDNSSAAHGDAITTTSVVDLGVTNTEITFITNYNFYSTNVVTPIHTSSHYQSFETPYLHELVGGDRNMEQTNLVVSPDGKTWDQITRDVSYLGGMRVQAEIDSADQTSTSYVVLDEWRGKTNERDLFNKDFAIAYDRLICLVSGQYEISFGTFVTSSLSGSAYGEIQKNGTKMVEYRLEDANYSQPSVDTITSLVRGDYIQIKSSMYDHTNAFFHIKKI